MEMQSLESARLAALGVPDARSRTRAPREVLTFTLGAEEYGIDILCVQEIRSWEQPTRIADAPPHVQGVVNLRGSIVPVLDLRRRFGVGGDTPGARAATIVIVVGADVIGVVVDGVTDVVSLDAKELLAIPPIPASAIADHLVGIGAVAGRSVIVIDIEGLMTGPELGLGCARALQ